MLCVKLAIYALCVNFTTNYILYENNNLHKNVYIKTIITHMCVKAAQQYVQLYVNSNTNYTLCVKPARYLTQNV